MNKLSIATIAVIAAFAAGNVAAQDMKKDAGKDAMAKPMTMQECKDYMAKAKTDAEKKDPAMMKKDTACAEMMKKDGGAMKAEPAKK